MERIRALDQVNADRTKTIQHAEVHGLARLRAEPLHDGLSDLAQPESFDGPTSQGEQTVRKLVTVVARVSLNVSPPDQGDQ